MSDSKPRANGPKERAATDAMQSASTPDDDLSASIHVGISRIIEIDREKARAYLAEFQNGDAFTGTPVGKISAAREFVRKSKVGIAALRIWRVTIHYHAWCNREDWPKWNDIGVSEVVEKTDMPSDSTCFRWNNRTWMFALEKSEQSYSRGQDLGRFRVSIDGELVMELAVAKGYGEFDEWYETDVQALTVGSWALALVEMWAKLELAQQRRRAATERARLEAQASRIKLG